MCAWKRVLLTCSKLFGKFNRFLFVSGFGGHIFCISSTISNVGFCVGKTHGQENFLLNTHTLDYLVDLFFLSFLAESTFSLFTLRLSMLVCMVWLESFKLNALDMNFGQFSISVICPLILKCILRSIWWHALVWCHFILALMFDFVLCNRFPAKDINTFYSNGFFIYELVFLNLLIFFSYQPLMTCRLGWPTSWRQTMTTILDHFEKICFLMSLDYSKADHETLLSDLKHPDGVYLDCSTRVQVNFDLLTAFTNLFHPLLCYNCLCVLWEAHLLQKNMCTNSTFSSICKWIINQANLSHLIAIYLTPLSSSSFLFSPLVLFSWLGFVEMMLFSTHLHPPTQSFASFHLMPIALGKIIFVCLVFFICSV